MSSTRLSSIFGTTVPTPICVLRTSAGSLCYTTVDLQENIAGSYLCQFEIGDYVAKPFGSTGIHDLIKRRAPSASNATAACSSDSNTSSSTTPGASAFEGVLSARHMDANSVSGVMKL